MMNIMLKRGSTDSLITVEYIPGEVKEINMLEVFNLLIVMLFIIYLIIWGIYKYLYREVAISNINLR